MLVSKSSFTTSKKLLETLKEMTKLYPPRVDLKKKGFTSVYVQFLGSGANGAPHALCLVADHKRYLFNCGECTQRVAHEHKVNLSTLEHVFITSNRWKNIGGLPGLALTLQNVGVSKLTLHGPAGLENLFKSTQWFLRLRDVNITVAKHSPASPTDFEDDLMTVKCINLGPQATNNVSSERDTGGADIQQDDKHYPHIENAAEELCEAENQQFPSMAYICTLKLDKCSIDLDRSSEQECTDPDVPVGRDTVGPVAEHTQATEQPAPVFIVLDVSDPSHIAWSQLEPYFDVSGAGRTALVVHFSPQHVVSHAQYAALCARWSRARHVLCARSTCGGGAGARRTQRLLQRLDAHVFPPLRDVAEQHSLSARTLADLHEENTLKLLGSSVASSNVLVPRTLSSYHLWPHQQFDRSREAALQAAPGEAPGGAADAALRQYACAARAVRARAGRGGEHARVVFLGTGSRAPDTTRNTSAIVLHVDKHSSMLLDCGEGTYCQMVRFYGARGVHAFLRSLQLVYISHLHPDHHMGLVNVVAGRRAAWAQRGEQAPPLCVVAPAGLRRWLSAYDTHFQRIGDQYQFVPSDTLRSAGSCCGVRGAVLRTCRAQHGGDAHALRVTLARHSLTYSGDTRPCDDVVALGADSSLLIHEATLDHSAAHEALSKRHSTTSEALWVARRMRAHYTVLTHFSTRWGRLPRLHSDALSLYPNVCIAFDFMQINLNELEVLPLLYEPLQHLGLCARRGEGEGESDTDPRAS